MLDIVLSDLRREGDSTMLKRTHGLISSLKAVVKRRTYSLCTLPRTKTQ